METLTHPDLVWTLSDRLRKAREAAGLSQAELAERAGISRETVSNYENPRYTKRRRLLFIDAAWVRCTPATIEWLLGDDVEWPDDDGAPPGIRTQNLRIKSPLLCR